MAGSSTIEAPAPSWGKRGKWIDTLIIFGALLTVIVVCGALFVARSVGQRRTGMNARRTMDVIAMAVEDYHKDFNAFPPDDTDGSVMIWKYLCRVHEVGEMHYGPYLKIRDEAFVDAGDGNKRLLSPYGGKYEYAILKDVDGLKRQQYVLIDPGEDKKTGGYIDPKRGFVIDDPESAKDNLPNATHD